MMTRRIIKKGRNWQLQIGGRPGPFYRVNDISVYLGRQRGGRGPQMKEPCFAHVFFVLDKERYVFHFANIRNSSTLTETRRKGPA